MTSTRGAIPLLLLPRPPAQRLLRPLRIRLRLRERRARPVGEAQAAVHAQPAIDETVSGGFIDDEPMCTWAGDSGKVALNAIRCPLKDDPFDGRKPVMSMDPMTSVPGLGGTAGIDEDELDVVKGDVVLSIETTGRTDLSGDQMVALAKAILARL